MKTLIAPLVALALAFAGCGSKQGPSTSVRRFLGDEAVRILSQPKKVEVYRVKDSFSRGPATEPTTQPSGKIAGLEIVARAPDQDATFGREIASIFFTDEAYSFNVAKACMFQPDTLLRIYGEDGMLDIVLCFHCEEFEFVSYDKSGASVKRGHEDFDGVRDRLAALVKRATGVEPFRD